VPLYTRDSLDRLREKVDLVELLRSHIDLKPAGAAYKSLCPFHEEKSPSFSIQRGSHHYHCFGCGAHGDGIAFLTTFLGLSFTEAVESLAERFQVPLERIEGKEDGGQRKKLLEAHALAAKAYQTMLLQSSAGREPLNYLLNRGVTVAMIERFGIGYAPEHPAFLLKLLGGEGFSREVLEEGGLVTTTQNGKHRDFFIDRITFPLQTPQGGVVGFSARKFKEETFGGKYINSQETPLFKKSNFLFGMSYSRRRIAKEQKAIIVEGQLDALRLMEGGLDLTVASLGTAFGASHVRELLRLGVREVYLAFDGDKAGIEAAKKVGDLFQKEGIEVWIPPLPPGDDPDSFVRQNGIEPFVDLLEKAEDYLTFLYHRAKGEIDLTLPAVKSRFVTTLSEQIKTWNSPLMVHESLKKLAFLAGISENLVGAVPGYLPSFRYRRLEPVGELTIDPDLILEGDLLLWLLRIEKREWTGVAYQLLQESFFRNPLMLRLFREGKKRHEANLPFSLLEVAYHFESEKEEELFSDLMKRKVDFEKCKEFYPLAIKKLLDREWLFEREEIREKLQSGTLSDDEALELARRFDALRRSPPSLPTLL
jgi:DNA primase